MKRITLAGLAVIAIAFTLCSHAQTPPEPVPVASGPSFTGSAEAVAFRYQGAWGTGSLTTESLDFIDFGKTKSNHIFLEGRELVAPNAGLSIYSGGIGWQPDLSKLLSKTNVSPGNLSVSFDEALGAALPSKGNSHLALLLGGGIRYKASTSLTWNALSFHYVREGSTNAAAISTGLAFLFGK